jgi:membrane protein involved in colicin uptake
MDELIDRIRYARDRALMSEETERQRLADADDEELERAASVRLASRRAVREALDDILGDESDPRRATVGGG